MICPKCGHQRTEHDDPIIPDYQCPACGIVYAKYKPKPLETFDGIEPAQESNVTLSPLSEPPRGRVSITLKQLDDPAAQALLNACIDITNDGQISPDEVTALYALACKHQDSTLPAWLHIRYALQMQVDTKELHKVIEKIMPVPDREVAVKNRKQHEQAEAEKYSLFHHANFMIAGSKYEGRPKVIKEHVAAGDDALLIRDKNNRFSQHAVKVCTKNGFQVGFIPEFEAEKIASLIDKGADYDAVFTKILGYDYPIPVVDVEFFDKNIITPEPKPITPKATPKPAPTEQQILLDTTECQRHKTNHILHFLISVISFGGWVIIWLLITAGDTSSRNDIHKKYNIPQEPNNAGLFILLMIGLVVFSLLIKK